MQPNDVFERSYVKTIAELETAMRALEPVAAIDHETTRGFWRGRVDPHAINACRFEVILYRAQMFDITLGPETYEGRKVANLAVFVPILVALAQGHVVTRRWSSTVTGAPVLTETLVSLAGGLLWQDRHELLLVASERLEKRDMHYVAYAR